MWGPPVTCRKFIACDKIVPCKSALRQISWELVSSRFARCPILFKPLGAKESSNVELLVQFLIVTESCSSGKICFPRHQAQATQIGVKTLGLMRTYGFSTSKCQCCRGQPPRNFICNWKLLFWEDSFSDISSLQATRIGVKTLKSACMRTCTYGLLQLQDCVHLSSFLNLKISVLSRSAAKKLSVTESCSSGEICFRRFQAQATQIGVKTLKSAWFVRMDSSSYHMICVRLFSFLNLKMSMLSRWTAEKLWL